MSVHDLLEKISQLHIRQEEISKLKGDNFNVFKLCGVNYYETRHSDIIAEFLDPKGAHGCGIDFLQAFCQIVGLNFDKFENAEIDREYPIPDGRLDILIQSQGNRIIIENKIYAGEGEEQLKRYREWLDKKAGNQSEASLYFLTLDGRPSSIDDEIQGQYNCISYKNHIISWLTECIRIAVEKPFIRESLLQYRNLVEELTKGNKMSEEDKKIAETIQKDFSSAIAVKRHTDQAKAMWLWDNILDKLIRDEHFTADRDRDTMIDSQDVFLSYFKNHKKVTYAFNQYGFKVPRREIVIYDASDKIIQETRTSTGKCPHNWDDDFFTEITPDNASDKATEAINKIIADKDKVLSA
ncbi:MAG: PD-(D/E)XK nuclease family protein [Lentisphaeria bacterium]|nr:PD-(D/E)XK nuclease family protein [Lentisphaeria bacterium]